ncbi:hypothetical protein [Usitatibacter palustris]|uniref:Uncharacterized protein n=1 Tax=Usitatibacter palustris TaxID=2732487 RepID=A0A6M4H676_9PROT|nr:hypothetical protein [Usitatibacter palustris]QJR14163.1 hypothetical protein DSM104440_00956 [Usitatibacter palustris]
MRRIATCLLLAAPLAWAQSPSDKPPESSVLVKCAECGVVRSVKRVEKETRPTEVDKSKPSGFVATIPLGKGAGKPTVGSSNDAQENEKPPVVSYEIIVRLDDGRFRVVIQAEADNIREGDQVKVVEGKVVIR